MKYAEQLGNPFDMVFIDMIMPVVEGWHLASEIKNDPKLKKTKLYMLVPEGQMGRDAKMKLLDWFEGYLYKPIRREKLDSLLIETNGDIPAISLWEKLQGKEKETEQDEKEAALAKGIKVLIAEDHPANRRILVKFLEKFGATIIQAVNGKEAVDAIEKTPDIQLVFMDIQMPVLSGTEATKQLRALEYHGIIIACTANNDPVSFDQYKDIGINDILTKPFKRANVKEALEKWKAIINLPAATNIPVLSQHKPIANDEIWDIMDFEDTIGNDWDLGNQIIYDYIDQTRQFIISCKDLLENKDFEELHRIAHTLKGSSAAISANKLANISASLSQATKDKDSDAFLLHMLEFEEEFNIFILKSNKWDHKC